jgi:uncharacterized Zn finger protein
MKNQQPPVNLDLSNAQDVVCDNCGNYTFNEVVLMKRISALVSPTGKEAIVPIPTFACNACGFINKQFLPVKMTETEDAPRENKSRLSLEK